MQLFFVSRWKQVCSWDANGDLNWLWAISIIAGRFTANSSCATCADRAQKPDRFSINGQTLRGRYANPGSLHCPGAEFYFREARIFNFSTADKLLYFPPLLFSIVSSLQPLSQLLDIDPHYSLVPRLSRQDKHTSLFTWRLYIIFFLNDWTKQSLKHTALENPEKSIL